MIRAKRTPWNRPYVGMARPYAPRAVVARPLTPRGVTRALVVIIARAGSHLGDVALDSVIRSALRGDFELMMARLARVLSAADMIMIRDLVTDGPKRARNERHDANDDTPKRMAPHKLARAARPPTRHHDRTR